MKKSHLASYYAGDDGLAQMVMKVYSANTKEPITKRFVMLKKDITEGGEQLFFTYFERPSDIQRTTFLVQKHIDQDDFRRLYIPTSDKILPIAGSRKQDPFMGSDFSYEDVSGRHYSKDNHKFLSQEKLGSSDVYVIESTPIKKEELISKIKYWVDVKNFIPLKVEFYNQKSVVFKEYNSENIVDVQGYPTIMKRVMHSPIDKTKTELLVNPSKVKYNIGLKAEDFSERSLKNPPMQYLQ
jgi:hypothetical protein